jgi:hypothetical protein
MPTGSAAGIGSGTVFTDAPYFHLAGHHSAKALDGSGNGLFVEDRRLEVPGQPAAHADIVVVGPEVCIEADVLPPGAQSRYQAKLVEQPEGPVHRIQGHRGHPGLHRLEDRLGVRMLQTAGNLPEDLQALVGQLDPRIPCRGLESLHPAPKLCLIDFHKLIPICD